MSNTKSSGAGTAAAKDTSTTASTSTAAVKKGDGTYSPSAVKDPFTLVMSLDRVTKNAVRYQEEHASDTEPDRIGQLYLQKSNWPKGAPNRIVVTVGRLE